MTREEAIKGLKNVSTMFTGYKPNEEMFAMAIKALEQEPCDDCISRQAAKLKVARVAWDDGDSCYDFLDKCVDCLDDLPSVKPKEKIGRWINFGIHGEIDGQIVKAFVCSECGAISVFRMVDGHIVNGGLCPNCEAKMVESEDKE